MSSIQSRAITPDLVHIRCAGNEMDPVPSQHYALSITAIERGILGWNGPYTLCPAHCSLPYVENRIVPVALFLFNEGDRILSLAYRPMVWHEIYRVPSPLKRSDYPSFFRQFVSSPNSEVSIIRLIA